MAENADVTLNQQRMRLNALWNNGKLTDLQLSQIDAAQLTRETNAIHESSDVSEAMEKLAIGRGMTSDEWAAVVRRRADATQKGIDAHRARQASGEWDAGTSGHGFGHTQEDNPYVQSYELEEIRNLGFNRDTSDEAKSGSYPFRTLVDEGASSLQSESERYKDAYVQGHDQKLSGDESFATQVDAYYRLWKHNPKKYSHIPSYVERTYGNDIRAMTSTMRAEGKESGLIDDRTSSVTSLISAINPAVGLAARFITGLMGEKHESHKQLDEMMDYGRVNLPKGPKVAKVPREYPGGIDWSKYKK